MKIVLVTLGVSLVSALNLSAQAPCQFTTTAANVTETCGRVGIGATNPAALLEITKPATINLLRVGDGTSFMDWYGNGYNDINAYGAALRLYSNSNGFQFRTGATDPAVTILNNGNVGIGTGAANPVTKLQVVGDIAASGSMGVNGATPRAWASGTAVQGPTSASFFGNSGDIHMISNAYTTGTAPGWKYMAAGVASNMYLYNGEVVFRTATSGSADQDLNWTTAMRIKNSGKVGIGIDPTSTDAMLHVAGDVIVDGNLAAKYQDVAEWVPAAEEMAAGTVVVVSGTTKNTVGPSQHAYDTRVAGVVSAQPGLTLGEGSSTKAKIATTGRVRVRVDATKHAIAMGDLLVTSDTSGAAMFSEPLDLGGVKIHRPGTLIGKALEPLASGEGEILVLLSLQ